jgi:hypothetical protein
MAEGGLITCPHCHRSFELTTAMSAAIEARLRQQVEDEVKRRTAELDAREKVITEKALAAERDKTAVEEEIATRLGAERKKLVDQLKQQAREEASFEVKNLQEQVRDQLVKLEAARQREQAVLKKEGDLEERTRMLEVEVADKVKSQRTAIVAVEAKKARDALGDEIAKAQQEKAAIEELLKQRDAKLADAQKKELELLRQQRALEDRQRTLEQEAIDKLKLERVSIAAAEAKKARDALGDEIAKALQEKAEAEAMLKQRDAKLAEAQKNELELRRERQTLHEERERFELEKQRAIDAERAQIREAAVKDADEQARLRIAEKEKTITDLQAKLQDALRKAEQGSQQLQGEVQELELEALLRSKFPLDRIEPVPKGEHGGDVLHHVSGPLAQLCGTILWESKRTKNWSDGWLPKLREDQRAAKAEVAVIISRALPKGIEAFDLIDGVWVAHPRCMIPVGMAIRQLLLEVATARQATEGQQTKMEMIYQYLTGPRFRLRVQAIVEAFSTMQEDLDRERKAIMKQWEKRHEQLDRVMQATVGMYGDLQGIAGKSLQEIDGLDLRSLSEDTVQRRPQLP